MKSLMLEENNLFNKDVLEGDFYEFAKTCLHNKEKEGKVRIFNIISLRLSISKGSQVTT
jgi:hypothetical protein